MAWQEYTKFIFFFYPLSSLYVLFIYLYKRHVINIGKKELLKNCAIYRSKDFFSSSFCFLVWHVTCKLIAYYFIYYFVLHMSRKGLDNKYARMHKAIGQRSNWLAYSFLSEEQ